MCNALSGEDTIMHAAERRSRSGATKCNKRASEQLNRSAQVERVGESLQRCPKCTACHARVGAAQVHVMSARYIYQPAVNRFNRKISLGVPRWGKF